MKKRNLILPTVAMLALIGCDDRPPIDDDSKIQVSYDTKEACLQDWKDKAATDPDTCVYSAHSNSYMSPWVYYYIYMNGYNTGVYHSAPYFYSSYGARYAATEVVSGGRMGSISGGQTSISRGGFGSIGEGVSGHGG